jgi:hypothetical protein
LPSPERPADDLEPALCCVDDRLSRPRADRLLPSLPEDFFAAPSFRPEDFFAAPSFRSEDF